MAPGFDGVKLVLIRKFIGVDLIVLCAKKTHTKNAVPIACHSQESTFIQTLNLVAWKLNCATQLTEQRVPTTRERSFCVGAATPHPRLPTASPKVETAF